MNSEIICGVITSVDYKQGVSKKEREYRLNIITAKITEDSGFKSSLPVIFNNFVNKGAPVIEYKVGDKIRIGVDALEIDKRSIKVTRGVII